MSVRILHTADNHLDPHLPMFGSKLMDRRVDFWNSFREVLNYALEHKPDILLIAGDLYDKVNPRNPPRVHLIRYFRKLHSEGVKTFIIGGHHDTPRSLEEGASPIDEIASSGYVTFFSSRSDVEAQHVRVKDFDVCISGVTYDFSLLEGEDPLRRVKVPVEGEINIFMAHYIVEGFKAPLDISGPTVKLSSIPRNLNYMALGHLHRYQEGRVGNTFLAYSGSTERKSFLEEDEEKGFIWIEMDKEKIVRRAFIHVPSRPMKTVKFKVTQEVTDPTSQIISEALNHRDEKLVLRVKVLGKAPLSTLKNYRRDAILRELLDKFFTVIIDDLSLEYEGLRVQPSIQRLSPLQAFLKYMDEQISKAKSEEDRKAMEKAKEIGGRYLEEEGAW